MVLGPGTWEGWEAEGKEVCTVGNTSSGSRKKMVDAGSGNTMYVSTVRCTSFIIRKLKVTQI